MATILKEVIHEKAAKPVNKPETKLAQAVVSWLIEQGWEVWQEVQFYRSSSIHDIIAVKCGLTWTIECKMTMNLTVIAQAERTNTCFRSIAIPRVSRSNISAGHYLGERICREKGIGKILVDKDGMIPCSTSPQLFRFGYKDRVKLIEDLKLIPKTYAEAGSKHGHWTPYRQTMDDAKRFIQDHPGCSLKEIMAAIDHHYKSDKTAKACIPKALSLFEKWCKIKDGKYFVELEPK